MYSSYPASLFAKLVDYLLRLHFNKNTDSFDHLIDGKKLTVENPIKRQYTKIYIDFPAAIECFETCKNLHAP